MHNFRRWEEAEIELGNPVVFVGPNDSGKTSALQALALWNLGLRRWTERRGQSTAKSRTGVTVNRHDLIVFPAPHARQLWFDLGVRQSSRDDRNRQQTKNICIDIIVEGESATTATKGTAGENVTGQLNWSCGLEFDFANAESFYCRPLRLTSDGSERMPVPDEALHTPVVLLSPMSGLIANETRLDAGAVNVRLGEGRTAEVLRNLCYRVVEEHGVERWGELVERLTQLFGAELDTPRLIPERGEIEMTYRTRRGVQLDLTASGRGMQQTLLLMAFIELNPRSVILLDEPDAHLEILRQRETYELLSETASKQGAQIIMASHSEVILNEAAQRGSVVAFVGSPHPLNKKAQVVKALRDIGFDQYYQAERTGFVLYLEGSTDLAILRAFATLINHDAQEILTRPFVHYVANQVSAARHHFYGLREAKPDLVGFALFDRLDNPPEFRDTKLLVKTWQRREIENYLYPSRTLTRYAKQLAVDTSIHPPDSMFAGEEVPQYVQAMERAFQDQVPPAALRDENARYWIDTKISDDLLAPVLEAFFAELRASHDMRKGEYHRLVKFLEPDEVHADVVEVLDSICGQHSLASPAS